MIDLRQALTDYLALRRGLGHELRHVEGKVIPFLDHLEKAGSPWITTALAVEWAMLPEGAGRERWARRLRPLRRFAGYVHTLDPRNDILPASLIPVTRRRKPVYLYSEEEVRAVIAAAAKLGDPFRALTLSTLIGLLAATGMRVGEAIRLDCLDLDKGESLLTIRDSKFGKSREVALHPTTLTRLQDYSRQRHRRFPESESTAFFLSLGGRRLIYQNVHVTFHRIISQMGMADRKPRRPCIHDLRHSFAMWTLCDGYRQGLDLERRLPLLSTYLGHVDPSSTYWYLSAAPELMGLAVDRLEKHLGELP